MTRPEQQSGGRVAQVIVYPRGQLKDIDRARLEAVGIVAVEADDPKLVVTAIPSAPLATADDILLSAIEAIAGSTLDSVPASFVRKLNARLQSASAGTQP